MIFLTCHSQHLTSGQLTYYRLLYWKYSDGTLFIYNEITNMSKSKSRTNRKVYEPWNETAWHYAVYSTCLRYKNINFDVRMTILNVRNVESTSCLWDFNYDGIDTWLNFLHLSHTHQMSFRVITSKIKCDIIGVCLMRSVRWDS